MAKRLKVYLLSNDSKIQPQLLNIVRDVQDADVDSMRKAVRTYLESNNYRIRTINFSPSGEVCAYVYHVSTEKPSASSVSGWVFKRPDLKPTT